MILRPWGRYSRCPACTGLGNIRVQMPPEERKERLKARRERLARLRKTFYQSYLRYLACRLSKTVLRQCRPCKGSGSILVRFLGGAT
jgi:hypothetical protein